MGTLWLHGMFCLLPIVNNMNWEGVLGKGVLGQAKNGDELFWEEKISCSQLEGPSMHSRCLAFLPFKFWVGVVGKEFYFHFSLVPNVFPMCSLEIFSIRIPSGKVFNKI
jgi:hypothetical protein